MAKGQLICLDRDGVVNAMVVNPEHGTVDSPLHPDQVDVFPWVPQALTRLTEHGYRLFIVSNQPAAAKGKTTMNNLHAVHHRVLELAQPEGPRIEDSLICYHRQEDGCSCRKPEPSLLLKAAKRIDGFDPSLSWMVGDGITDVEAGLRAGFNTAFLGPKKCDICNVFRSQDRMPTCWAQNLLEFARYITS